MVLSPPERRNMVDGNTVSRVLVPSGTGEKGQQRTSNMPSKHAASRGSPWMLIILAAVVLLTFAGGFLTGHSVSSSQSHPKPVATAPAHPHPNPTPTPPAPHPAPHKPHHVTYTVHPGDTLWGIAGHIYHNPVQWQHLYHVNSKVIGLNPNLIHVGTVLQLE